MERLTNAAAETGIPSSGERMVRILIYNEN